METRSIYRRPKFLELLLEIRQQMARDADYDVDLFAEMIRSGVISERPRDEAGETRENVSRKRRSQIS
ncbi:MAG: hypothetical protein ACR2IH_08480 [Pyrinomonadaceae bacterium]